MKSIRTFFVCLSYLFIPFLASATTCNDLQIVSIKQTQTSCNANDATAIIDIINGSGNYSYQWTDLSDNSLISESTETDLLQDNVTNLGVGYYQVKVEDLDNNCSVQSYFSIENQDAPTLDIIQASAPSSCTTNDGFLLFNTSTDEAQISIIDLQDANNVLKGEFVDNTIAGLSSGNYVLQIMNDSDCSNFYFFEIPIGEANFEIIETISQPNCDASNGGITLNVTNNSGNTITYNWFAPNGEPINPADPLHLTGLAAGVYSLTASSKTGCESQYSFSVESMTTMRIDVTTILDIRCTGNENGSFDFRIIDGTAPFNYSVPELGIVDKEITSATTTINNLQRGGIYTLQVTDNTNCTVTEYVEVSEPLPFELDIKSSEVSYCNATDGEICFLLTGGTPPYRISDASNDFGIFETSEEYQCITFLAANTYNINIIDESGCTLAAPSIIVEEPENCTCCDNFRLLGTSETSANCGSTNGVSSLTLDGGSGNYTVTWHNALTDAIVTDQSSSQSLVEASDMAPGSYYAIAEDSDCSCMPQRHDFIINESDAPTVNIIFENMPLLCPDENRASFEFEVVGNNGPFTYQILGSDINGDVTDLRSTVVDNLVTGSYVVEVTDFFGCKGYSTVVSTITPDPIILDIEVLNIAQCNDDKAGSIGLNIQGGTPPFRITDDTNDYGFFNTGQHYINDLPTGAYTFDITDNNGCVTNTGALAVTPVFNCDNCDCGAFNLQNMGTTPETCAGNDGSLDLNVSNGVGPFTYTLRQDGNTLIQYQSTANIFTFNGLPAGDYDIDVKDANCNCEILNETSNIGSSGIEATLTQTDIDCNTTTGEICLTISGGNAPYAINDGTGDIGSFAEATEQCISDLTAGEYNYTITDAEGCSTVKTFNIQSNDTQIEVGSILSEATQGNSDGEFCLTISGGTAPYQVTDDSNDYGSFDEAASSCVSDVPGGNYMLIITDANGCSTTETFTIEEEVVAGSIEVVVNSTSEASCSDGDGSFCVSISGGTAPYTLTDGDLVISDIAETTENCTNNLTANTYNFTVSDSNGNTAPQTLAITIQQASLNLNISQTTSGETCAGDDGEFCLTISGGNAPYNVTDGTSDFGTFEENIEKCVSNLPSRIYSLLISDANACTTAESVAIGLEGNNLAVTSEVTDASCGISDGEVCLTISGGTAPYSVREGDAVFPVEFLEATENCLLDFPSGTFTLTITDADGCSIDENITVETSSDDNNLAVTIETTSGCSDNSGQICLSIVGGTAPYSVSDENVDYGDLDEATEECFGSLASGTYNFSITDANGCTTTEIATISQDAANNITITVNDKATCSGTETCVTIEGGNAPYSLKANKTELGTFEEGIEGCFNALPNGFHNLTVTDNTGCTKLKTVLISNDNSGGSDLTAIVEVQDVSCTGTNGEVCLTISGGTAPYSVSELDAVFPLEFLEATENCIDNFSAGTYTLTITDSNGCSTDETVTVGTTAANISATVETTAVSCDGDGSDGEICLTITGGTAPYTVTDNNNQTYTNFGNATEKCTANFAAGDYTLNITDANGCTFTTTASVGPATDCGENTPPIAIDDNFNIEGNGASCFNVLNNDNQTEGDELTLKKFEQPSQGTVVLGATNGELCYTPPTDFEGVVSFTYTVCDDDGCVDGTVKLTITQDNTPCENPTGLCTGLMTPINFCVEFCNVEGITDIEDVNTLFDCGITTDGLCVEYIPLPGFIEMQENLEIIGCNDLGICDTVYVDIYVGDCNNVNQAPIAVDDSANSDGNPISINVLQNDSDPDGDTFNITEFTQPSNGTVTQVGDELVYTPNPDFEGNDTFTYTICDEEGLCDTATVTIRVELPCTNPSNLCTGLMTPIEICVEFCNVTGINEIDDVITLFDCGITTDGLCVIYTPLPGFIEMTEHLQIIGCNDLGICDTVFIDVYVGDCDGQNKPPVATDDFAVTSQDKPIPISVLINDSDPNGDPFSITNFTQPTNGTVTQDGTTLVYTPNTGFVGEDTFTYTICDDSGECDTATVTVQVNDDTTNKPPVAVDDSATTDEGVPVAINVTANDSDPNGDPFIITDFTQPTNGTVKIDDTTFVYTPNAGFVGEDTFTYTICDDSGECDTATVTIQVNPDNENLAPVAVDDTAETDENTPVTINVTANDSDPNGDSFTITGFTAPPNGTVELINGQLVYTPNDGFSGTDTFTYQICDNGGLCDEATVTVTVIDVCSEYGQFICAEPLQTIEICPVFCDLPDEDLHIISATSTFACGTDIPENSLCFDYTPLPGFNLTDSIEVIACTMDSLLCDTVIFYVFSGCSNPIAIDDTATTPNDQTATIDVLANDWGVNCIEELDMNITSNPSNGIAMINQNNEIVYTPNPNFVGVDVLQYQLCDLCGEDKCDEATVTITITDGGGGGTDPIVIAAPDVVQTPFGISIDIEVLANDTGENVNITNVTPASNGTATIHPDGGSIIYEPNTGYSGTDYFFYTICDPTSVFCSTTIVSVTVLPDGTPNQPPTANDDTATTPINTSVTIPVLANDSDPENANLTIFSITQLPTNGTAEIVGGQVVYTPFPGFEGIDVFVYVACDPGGLCDQATVTVSVGGDGIPNNPPVANPDEVSTPLNTPITINVLANDSDPDGDNLTVALGSDPMNGFASVAPDGSIIYTPNTGFEGTDFVTYILCDDGSPVLCDTTFVTINVTNGGGGDPIVIAAPDVVQTPFNTPVGIDVLANDTGENVNITNVTTPSNGTATLQGDGTILYEPNAGYSGTDYFFYTICDPTGVFCSTTIVSVTVLPENTPNQPPVANDDTATTPVNVAVTINVLANDSDPENAPLSVISITEQPSNGTVEIIDNQVVYTPNPNFEGVDDFVYMACDPDGLCDPATVTIAVGGGGIGNNPPIANPDEVDTPLNTPITIDVLINDSDPDGDNLTVTLGSNPMNGTATVSPDGSIVYTPDTGFEGTDFVTYILCDDGTPVLCDTTFVTINVGTGSNNPIVIAAPDVVQTPFNISVSIDVLANDTGENLVITQVTQGENGIVAIAGDVIVYQPNAGFSGVDYFFYTICDPTGVFCDNTIVSVTVLPENTPNLAPIANNDIAETPVNTPVTIPVLANDSDPEGAPLTITGIPNPPTNGTVEIVNGAIVYTPNPDFIGMDSFTYAICDPQGLCDAATVGVAVGLDGELPNNPPIAVEDVANTPLDTPVSIPVLANDSDPDGDNLTVTLGSDPMHGTATVDENGNINYTPDTGFEGTDFLTYILCDDGSPVLCDTTFVTINVGVTDTTENQPPIAVDDTGSTLIDTPVDILVLNNDSDPDGDNIVITAILTQPTNGAALIGADTSSITYLPNPGFIGVDCFDYQICDPDGLCDVATVCVTVQPPADANPDVAFTPIETPVVIAVLANDFGVDITITDFTQPENGTATLNPDNTFTYTPNPGFTGDDYFTYQICDAFGNCDETVVAVNVYDGEITGNNPPTANNDTAETPINTPVTVPVLDNDTDPDGDPLTVTDLLDIPVGVGLEITDDGTTVTVTPDSDFEGCVVFSYVVCDPFEGCDTAQVGVAVGDVDCLNNAPIAVDDDFTTPQGEAISFDVLANDSDPDGDNLTASPITEPANGMLIEEEDGTFTYIPNADFVGTDFFLYVACDDGDTPPLCDTAVVTIVVQPSEVEPIEANPDIVQTAINTPIDIPVLDNDEGEGLTVSEIVTNPENGSVTTDGTTVVYTPDPDFVGTDYFIYEACNATGQCDTTLVTVIVLPDSITNVAPVAVNDVDTTPQDTPVQIAVLLNDFDPFGGDTLVITTFTVPTNGTAIFDANGVFTYTPDPDFIGIDSFTYTICDNGTPILCDVGTVVITVGSDELNNNPPIAVDDEVTTPPNTPINIPILDNDSDPDSDNLVITFVSIPTHGTAELVGDEVLYTPDSTYVGDDFFSYIICDDGLPVLCDTAYVTIHVTDEVFDNIADITVTENSDNVICLDSLIASGILTLDFNPDSLNITSLPTNGIATPSDTSLICFNYSPDLDFTGTDQLILEVCEGTVCETVTVNINVIPLDDIVVIAEDDAVTTDINTPIDIPVLGNDAYPTDGSGIVDLIIVDLPSNGTVVVNGDILGDTTITYTPDTDFAGVDSFQYALCYTFADTAICDTALVIITIDSENNPCEIKFANAFSPNNDGINDLFLIENADNLEECFETIGELVIFNRWGDEVYRIDGYDNSVAWDGTWQNNGNDVPDGTYFYVLKYIVETRPVAVNGFVEVCR